MSLVVETFTPMKYPIISISYCVKCKWGLRANWYVQEILQTFTNSSKPDEFFNGSILLNPSLVAGTFTITMLEEAPSDGDLTNVANWKVIFDRKTEGGFPDSKLIKQRIKALLFPNLKLNHVDQPNKNDGLLLTEDDVEIVENKEEQGATDDVCIECNKLN